MAVTPQPAHSRFPRSPLAFPPAECVPRQCPQLWCCPCLVGAFQWHLGGGSKAPASPWIKPQDPAGTKEVESHMQLCLKPGTQTPRVGCTAKTKQCLGPVPTCLVPIVQARVRTCHLCPPAQPTATAAGQHCGSPHSASVLPERVLRGARGWPSVLLPVGQGAGTGVPALASLAVAPLMREAAAGTTPGCCTSGCLHAPVPLLGEGWPVWHHGLSSALEEAQCQSLRAATRSSQIPL